MKQNNKTIIELNEIQRTVNTEFHKEKEKLVILHRNLLIKGLIDVSGDNLQFATRSN